MSGDALTSVILIRNTMSFAIGYGITPWLTNMGKAVSDLHIGSRLRDAGTQNCFISAAFIGLAASLAFLLMVKWGKSLRERKRLEYWNLVRKYISLGALH